MVNLILLSPTLERMSKRTTKLLTLELDLETLAEFSAACEVFGARSKSTFLNQYVVQKIREAKQTVSRDEFSKIFDKQMQEIQERSERKSLERKKASAVVSGGTSIKAQASAGNEIKPRPAKNGELNFSGSTTKKNKSKEAALTDELDDVLKKRNGKKWIT